MSALAVFWDNHCCQFGVLALVADKKCVYDCLWMTSKLKEKAWLLGTLSSSLVGYRLVLGYRLVFTCFLNTEEIP